MKYEHSKEKALVNNCSCSRCIATHENDTLIEQIAMIDKVLDKYGVCSLRKLLPIIGHFINNYKKNSEFRAR